MVEFKVYRKGESSNAEPEKQLTWLNRLVKRLAHTRYFGKVTLHFQKGKIVNAELLNSIKPDDN